MPPRTEVIKALNYFGISRTSALPAGFLVPFLQQRYSSILSSLSDNKDAYNKRVRRGRGPASGKGKTSGRGHKGQKQHGKVPAGFNGGQTPDEVVNPVRGAPNLFAVDLSPLNVNRLQQWIDQGRLDVSKPITLKELVESRCIHSIKDGVKLLAKGAEQLCTPVSIVVSRASASAINAIEGAGGSIITRFYTPASIKRILRGETDPIFSMQSLSFEPHSHDSLEEYLYRLPDPTSRKDIEYYRDPAHRGYLSHKVAEGQGPSLFYNTMVKAKNTLRKESSKSRSTQQAAENRIW